MKEIAIAIEDLNKSFQDSHVIKDLNLFINQGEVYGFIGKNGAGKTTTINMILSLIHKNSGIIRVLGEEVEFTNQTYKSKIGYVPDVPVFPSFMNAYEYLNFTLDIFDDNEEKDKKILDTLNFVSLENTKKRISSYSRGMKQRLAIAQALIHDPEILIMDEPTSALDPQGRKDVIDIMMNLRGNKTIFYSTHILDDVERVCDRVGILHKGELILEDTIENIKDQFYARIVHIVTKSNPDNLMRLVSESKCAVKMRVENSGVTVQLKDDLRSNDLLEYLLKSGEEILSYSQVVPTVEEIFLQKTND
jgi:ABC-2 type transport system ATP-binding protein